MLYEQYIKLGFKREDHHDVVEFKHTGYYGFSLHKQINKRMFVSVCSMNLDAPKLYIQKRGSITCHILPITIEMVVDMFEKKKDSMDDFANAC